MKPAPSVFELATWSDRQFADYRGGWPSELNDIVQARWRNIYSGGAGHAQKKVTTAMAPKKKKPVKSKSKPLWKIF